MTVASDDELVRRARAGDDEACAALVRRHQDHVFGVAVLELRDRALAREVTQDVFVRAFRKLGGFRGEAAFSTWLHRVTLNACRDVRRRARRHRLFDTLDAAEHAAAPGHDRPDARLEQVERDARLRRAVRSLPDDLRQPLVLRYAGGLDYKTIARVLGLPLGTVCTRLQRAVRRLGEAIEKEAR